MKMSESAIDCVLPNSDEETAGNITVGESPVDEHERQSCKFGRQCFRQNPRHRLDMAHPGDEDYIVPNMPEPNADAVKCKYGGKCYRLNPEHFQHFTHPRNINIQENYKKYVLQRQARRRDSDSSFDYVSDEDPFAGDSDDSEYKPSDEE